LPVFDTNGYNYYIKEYFYRDLLCALLDGIGARISPEVHGIMKRTDIVLEWKQRNCVIEMKIANDGDNEETLLEQLASKMIKQRFNEPNDNPICLALVISDELGKITLYKVLTLPSDQETPHPARSTKATKGHQKSVRKLKTSRTAAGQTLAPDATDKGVARQSSSEAVEDKKKSMKSQPIEPAIVKKRK
jgi:hypothetical protein